ncbi:sugar-binding protein [Iodobacter sp. BJB302]|nr:carbohydrate-binding protein [Iodobacter sp. BJB302]PHV02698.1 sugar-binding protein [Iodobacter sp. BJB302]
MKNSMKHRLTILAGLLVSMPMAAIAAPAATKGSFQDFLDNMRAFESGIDPAKADFYKQNFNSPILRYAKVVTPGVPVRDPSTGSLIIEPTTVNQYFTKLGLNTIYNPNAADQAAMFKTMQYSSLNAWGFIGYQLGEALMIDTGYYSPVKYVSATENLDKFYIFAPDSTWANGVTEATIEIPGSGGNKVRGTHNNRWEGTFSGRNGVNSFADLKNPAKQEYVIRDAMRFNYGVMSEKLAAANITWAQALAKSWPGKDENGNPITIKATMSGLLAAAHLGGAWGAADLLITNKVACDEQGTCVTTYIDKFGNYDTQIDTPNDDTISGGPLDEVLSAGQGNDTVYTGGGKNTIYLSQFPGGTTTVKDFVVGKDKIVLRNWTGSNPLASLAVTDSAGGALLQFAGQSVLLEKVSAAAVKANPSAVIVVSAVYKLAWSGKQTATGFNPALDQIQGTSGLGFKHLKIFQDNGSLFIGTQAADGGIYSWIELPGVTAAQVSSDMFSNMSGSYSSLEFTVLLNPTTWGWGKAKSVDYFKAANTTVNLAAFAYNFSALALKQEGADVVLTLNPASNGGDTKALRLLNTKISDLSAKNFYGVTGNYSDMKIDDPSTAVYFPVTASAGTGGVIAPSGVVQVREKTNQVFTITPNTGYKIKSITVDGAAQAISSSFTLVNVTGPRSVAVSFEQGSSNTCAAAAWSATTVYAAGGTKVSHKGFEYTNKWWTQGNEPGTNDVWTKGAACQ